MDADAELDRGRQACRRQAWAEAYALLGKADTVRPLDAADVEALAEAADMLGRCDDAVALLRRAFTAYAGTGEVGAALRCAYWLCKGLAWGGELAQSGAWLARAQRLAATEPDCPSRGYLTMLEAELHFRAGEPAEMLTLARHLATTVGGDADPDLLAGTAMTLGLALVSNGEVAAGLAQLDEAMVVVADGTPSARCIGMTYCVVIGTCQDLQELRRAQEWAKALSRWCAAQPDFSGAYRGLCRVHRAALLQLGGAWPEADREARLACAQLTAGYGESAAGSAFYQLAELHRLRGEYAEAEQAYRDTLRHGWDTQPGLALLRLSQDRPTPAAAAIRRALAETTDPMRRARLLPAAVEILLAEGAEEGHEQRADGAGAGERRGAGAGAAEGRDRLGGVGAGAGPARRGDGVGAEAGQEQRGGGGAGVADGGPSGGAGLSGGSGLPDGSGRRGVSAEALRAADELAALAEAQSIVALRLVACQARGAVLLAQGVAGEALGVLREAGRGWRELDVPYEAARVGVLVALACRALGDEDCAALELDAAGQAFARLGALPDLRRVEGLRGRSVLSPRELDVVRLIAQGRTNHAIAAELVLSEKTVARHISNIFAKLDLGSRTAVAAYAFENGLVRPPGV
ncbi:response regulator transcription factor [Streptomyces justiciae]|uniref:response regulator transcription factor n=1 Tax=Streptomyces justiciae TaxID=2780140 RepID=UPI002119611C|nr:response regulator transcription factor [Streptomyces justiciae]MCW8384408.1 response regulator transcription factor [Streptomyces justiciae]